MFSGKNRFSHDFTTDGVAGSYSQSSDNAPNCATEVAQNKDKQENPPIIRDPARKYEKPIEYIKRNSLKEKETIRKSLNIANDKNGGQEGIAHEENGGKEAITNDKNGGHDQAALTTTKSDSSAPFAGKFASCKDTSHLTRRERLSSLDGVPNRSSLQEEPNSKKNPAQVKRSKSLKKRLSLRLVDLQNTFERIKIHHHSSQKDAKDIPISTPEEDKDENCVTKDENSVTKDENRVNKEENDVTKDDKGVTKDENDVTKDEKQFQNSKFDEFEEDNENELDSFNATNCGANLSLLEEVLSETSGLNLSTVDTVDKIKEEEKINKKEIKEQEEEDEEELKMKEIFKKCTIKKKNTT